MTKMGVELGQCNHGQLLQPIEATATILLLVPSEAAIAVSWWQHYVEKRVHYVGRQCQD